MLALYPICSDTLFGLKISQCQETLFRYIDIPVVSAGLIHWLKVTLTSPKYYT